MKNVWRFCLVLFACFPLALKAELTKPIDLLNAMMMAHKNTDYELHYILQQGNVVDSFRYTHTIENNQEFGQLLRLDNARELIVLKENIVSYLGRTFQPFSLKKSYIIDNLPSVFHTNFSQLEGYDFISLGKSRVANRIANVIRIVSLDNSRYSYTLWLDEENYLLLKSELYDEDNQLLEQFRVIKQGVGDDIHQIESYMAFNNTPPLVEFPEEKNQFSWGLNWLPKGFDQIAENLLSLTGNELVESRQYHDGLFTFTVYVIQNDQQPFGEALFKASNKLTIFSQTIEDKNVVVIGDIPLNTARKIALNVKFAEVEK